MRFTRFIYSKPHHRAMVHEGLLEPHLAIDGLRIGTAPYVVLRDVARAEVVVVEPDGRQIVGFDAPSAAVERRRTEKIGGRNPPTDATHFPSAVGVVELATPPGE